MSWFLRKPVRWWHVVHRYPHRDSEFRRRFEFARLSWEELYMRGWQPLHVWKGPRSSITIDPTRDQPFLKDIWKTCTDLAEPDDVMVYTNDDTVLHPIIIQVLDEWMRKRHYCCSFRNNYKQGQFSTVRDIDPAETEISYGRDLFAFKVWWLRKHWDRIPDVVIGTSEWDYYMGVYFRWLAKCKLSMEDMHEVNPASEIPRGAVFHEDHDATRHLDRKEFSLIEQYSIAEVTKQIMRLPSKGMHLNP